MSDQQPITTHYRACHLCEAICGLEIRTQGDEILSIKGDKKDPLSEGYICPKATAIADIHNDPDRLRKPVKRVADKWLEIEWDEAIELAAQGIVDTQLKHGENSVGFFAGNPGVHNYGNMTHGIVLRKAVKTRNHFSATSLDQLPHQLISHAMYGHQFFLPIPDVDHTQLMVIFGGNPLASNGSLMTMPNAPKRFKRLQQRGGQLIVVDPRRSETAEIADQHHFIRPGSDAFVLLAMIKLLFDKQWLELGHLEAHLNDLELVKESVQMFSLELAEQHSGMSADSIVELTNKLSNTEQAMLYGRMGVSVQEFGAVCQWAIQVINILIGALDRVGGTLLTSPPFAYVQKGQGGAGHFNVFQSRVRGLPEFGGELPSVTLAEEILTPGEGQIRSMITIAGNPVISNTNAGELDNAFASLDFYVAFDFYINATTRHADVILPPTSPLEHDHYDIAFLRLAVRDTARFNAAVFEPGADAMHDWQIFNAVAQTIANLKGTECRPLPAPHQIVDFGIQQDAKVSHPQTNEPLTMAAIKASQHGLDLGPLKPGVLDRLCTEDNKIELAPDFVINDLTRLLAKPVNKADELLLIGRRHIRSNNSWMHNYQRLVKGKPRWQLFMNPKDLAKLDLKDNSQVVIKSRVGEVTTSVVASDEMMPGVVSLPHGWGHNLKGVQMQIATQQQGVNCNVLTDDQFIDQASGNAALNGVPVTVSAAL